MARPNEISSTERLLDLIRNNNDSESTSSDISLPSSSASGLHSFFPNPFSFIKTVTVGVDIGHSDLKLVKVSRSSDSTIELLDHLKIPFESHIKKGTPQFSVFLKSALTNFCGSSKKIEIWSAVSSEKVEMRYVRIPKVSKKQTANAVYWTYKKKVLFNEKNEVFDYEILGDITEDGIQKTEVLAYTVSKQAVEKVKDIFSTAGYRLTGLIIIPFAFQNLLRTRWVKTDKKSVCSLFIGRDWSRIAIYSGGNLVLSRGIKAGMKSMVECIREGIDDNKIPVDFPIEQADTEDFEVTGNSDDKSQILTDYAKKIFFNFIYDSFSSQQKPAGLDFNEEEMSRMILPAIERLTMQVERTLEHYSMNFDNDRVGKIFISGRLSASKRIVNYLGKQFNLPVDVVAPFTGESLCLDENFDVKVASELEAFAPAMGIALSNNQITPNFIFTHKDKEKLSTGRRIGHVIFAAFIFFMAVCGGAYFWQGRIIERKKAEAVQLEKKMEKYFPVVDKDFLLQQAIRVSRKREAIDKFSKKYIGTAVIGEISDLTPPNIRLISMTVKLGRADQTEKKSEKQKKILVIDGVISGEPLSFEASLAEYLLKLKKSPVFRKPCIRKRSIEFYKNKETLRFTAQLEIV